MVKMFLLFDVCICGPIFCYLNRDKGVSEL